MVRALLHSLGSLFRSRADLTIEILALRQQLAIFKQRTPRPRLAAKDRVFWIALRRWWPNWRQVLIVVQPETVIKWHRRGFRAFWRRKSRPKTIGRPSLSLDIRQLIPDYGERESPMGSASDSCRTSIARIPNRREYSLQVPSQTATRSRRDSTMEDLPRVTSQSTGRNGFLHRSDSILPGSPRPFLRPPSSTGSCSLGDHSGAEYSMDPTATPKCLPA